MTYVNKITLQDKTFTGDCSEIIHELVHDIDCQHADLIDVIKYDWIEHELNMNSKDELVQNEVIKLMEAFEFLTDNIRHL